MSSEEGYLVNPENEDKTPRGALFADLNDSIKQSQEADVLGEEKAIVDPRAWEKKYENDKEALILASQIRSELDGEHKEKYAEVDIESELKTRLAEIRGTVEADETISEEDRQLRNEKNKTSDEDDGETVEGTVEDEDGSENKERELSEKEKFVFLVRAGLLSVDDIKNKVSEVGGDEEKVKEFTEKRNEARTFLSDAGFRTGYIFGNDIEPGTNFEDRFAERKLEVEKCLDSLEKGELSSEEYLNVSRMGLDNDRLDKWGIKYEERSAETDIPVNEEEPVVEEPVEDVDFKARLLEYISANEKKCLESLMVNFSSDSFDRNYKTISEMMIAGGADELVTNFQGMRGVSEEQLFEAARLMYINSLIRKSDLDSLNLFKTERDLALLVSGDVKKKNKQIDERILKIGVDLFKARGWDESDFSLFVKSMKEFYGISSSPELTNQEIDRVRYEVFKKIEQKLQFESNAKFTAPSLAELEAIYDKYNLDDKTRDEMKSLAGLMLLSRSNLYMKQDPKVWGGSSLDTVVDGYWINYAKKGIDDFVLRGFLGAKETDGFKSDRVSQALKIFFERGSNNTQATTGIEIELYCSQVSQELGISEYEARVAWMFYEQFYEPEYNSKNHLYVLTHTSASVEKIRNNWWGSPWMFTKAVTSGDVSDDPINDASEDNENGMPSRMWKTVGDRLFYIDDSGVNHRFSAEVSRGNAIGFLKDFYDTRNINVNQGVVSKLHNSANTMYGYFKKISEVGSKPESTNPKFLVELKNSLMKDMEESDTRKDKTADQRYVSVKSNFLVRHDFDKILNTVSRILFLQTSILHPGIDDKTLIDPVTAVQHYFYLVSSQDNKTNFFTGNTILDSVASSKEKSKNLRDFVGKIVNSYVSNNTLMAKIEDKNEPLGKTIRTFAKDVANWSVPEKPIQYRDAWEIFRVKYGKNRGVIAKAGNAWNKKVIGSMEERMEDWMYHNLGWFGKIITGRK